MDTSTALEASSSSLPSSSSTTTTSSSSSSPYDVFLSFSGEDTRKTFTDHLYWTMKDAGIDFFMEENESIRRGENISDKVKQIIEGSRVSVIVFSSRYADSIWCLEELVQIMECRRTLKQMVLPIFYDLSPSDGIGTFVQAFQKHRERFHEDTDIQEKIRRWTDALTEAAGLTVRVFETTNGYEGMFIREIIDVITRQLKSPTPVGIAFSELQRRLPSLKLEDIDSTEHTDTASSGSSAKSSLFMSPLKKRCREPDHSDSKSIKFPKRRTQCGSEIWNLAPFGKTQSDTFMDGDLLVTREGVRIVSHKEVELPPPIHASDYQMILADLDAIKVIGKGNGGVVQLVQHKWTRQFFALKVIQMNIEESIRRQISQELKIHLSSQCPNIVVCYQSFYNNGTILMILEYMDGGSLANLLKKVKTIPEFYLAAICKQLLQGLCYLHHEKHIIHRDFKPSNLLINHRGEVKITDFGVSKIMASTSERANTFIGTYNYMSPERIVGDNYCYKSDIWSLGLILLECATGQYPYVPPGQSEAWDNFFELMSAIVEEPAPCAPSDQFSPEFCSFISACVQKDPKDRPSAQDLLRHPFINMYDDVDVDLSSYFTEAEPFQLMQDMYDDVHVDLSSYFTEADPLQLMQEKPEVSRRRGIDDLGFTQPRATEFAHVANRGFAHTTKPNI